jgi:hypothetical protein
VVLRAWARERLGDVLMGSSTLPLLPKGGKKAPPGQQTATLSLVTDAGQAAGQLSVSWSVEEEEEALGGAAANDWDVFAAGYCHLYSISIDEIKTLEAFVDTATNKPLLGRFPGGSRDVTMEPLSKRDSMLVLPSIDREETAGGDEEALDPGVPKITVTRLADAMDPPEKAAWVEEGKQNSNRALMALRMSVLKGSTKSGKLSAVVKHVKQADMMQKTLLTKRSTVVQGSEGSLSLLDAEEEKP